MRHRRSPSHSTSRITLAATAGFALLLSGAGAAWLIKESERPPELELRMRGEARASRTPPARAGEAPTPTPSKTVRTPEPKAAPPKKTRSPEPPKPKKNSPRPTSPPKTDDSRQRDAEDAAVRLTNAERKKKGCAPLRNDNRLRIASRKHSVDMAKHSYFSHTSRDGTSPWDRMKSQGYSWPGAENIAKGHRTAADVVTGWMKSTGHRANILNCNLKAIGVGVSFAAGAPVWTQDFGYR